MAMCHITRGPPGFGGESMVASPIGPPNETQMGPKMGPKWARRRGQPGAGTSPTWSRDEPNLEQGHAQPGAGTCPTWTWDMPTAPGPGTCPTWTRDMPNLEQGHAQPGPGTCPTWTWDMPNLDQDMPVGPGPWAWDRGPGPWARDRGPATPSTSRVFC